MSDTLTYGPWIVEWESGKTERVWVRRDEKRVELSDGVVVTIAGLPYVSAVSACESGVLAELRRAPLPHNTGGTKDD